MTSVGYVSFLVFVALVGLFASAFAVRGSMWPSLVSLLAIITGSAVIGPEFSTGALQLIVSKPIRRSVYLLSRVAGVLAAVAIVAVAGLTTEVTARLLREGTAPWSGLAEVFGGALAVSLLTISLLTFLGSLTRSYFNAAIYIGTEAALNAALVILGTLRVRGVGFGAYLAHHPSIERGVTTIDDVLFASVPGELTAQFLLRVAITVVVALALACVSFERREVPYGAD